jgi:hypothetical protein
LCSQLQTFGPAADPRWQRAAINAAANLSGSCFALVMRQIVSQEET